MGSILSKLKSKSGEAKMESPKLEYKSEDLKIIVKRCFDSKVVDPRDEKALIKAFEEGAEWVDMSDRKDYMDGIHLLDIAATLNLLNFCK